MHFFRIVAGFAGVATLLQLVAVTLLTAHWVTLEGNPLRVVSLLVGLVVAAILPLGLAFATVRALERREIKVRRGPVFAGITAVLNGVALTLLWFGLSSPIADATDGGARLLASTTASEQAPAPGPKAGAPGPEAGASAPVRKASTPTVEKAQRTVAAVLEGTSPAEHLSDESAAAVGALWMAFLTETYPDLEIRVGAERWAAVHADLPVQDDLWSDPAAIESDLTRRGRSFLAAVVAVADAANGAHDPARLTWPLLPKALLTGVVAGDGAEDAEFAEVAMNRVEVRLHGTQWDLRHEDGGWRLHLGDYGDLATRRVAPATLLIALGR